MATVKKSMKKYQMGGPVASKKKAAVDSVESEMFPGKKIPKSKSNYENGNNIATGKKAAAPKKKMQYGGAAASMVPPMKMDNMKMGGMKTGGKMKKTGMHKMPNGSMMKNSAMKSGGKMKKCAYGCK